MRRGAATRHGELTTNAVDLVPVRDGQVAWLYQHTQAVISANHYEGVGLPMGEAFALRAPSIVRYRQVHSEVHRCRVEEHIFPARHESLHVLRELSGHSDSLFRVGSAYL